MASIKDRPVGYLDELVADYTKQRQAAKTLPELWQVTARWEPVAGDAFDVVSRMTAAQFKRYQKGERMERKKQYAGDEWAAEFGAILIPEMLLRIGVIAQEYSVPDGCAFIRAVEVGRFKKREGRFYDDVAEKAAA